MARIYRVSRYLVSDLMPTDVKTVLQMDMFMSKVDREKYPNVSQKYRFELVESEV